MAAGMLQTIYHIDTGPATTYAIDAREAVAKFPEIWSHDQWPRRETPGTVMIPDNWRTLEPIQRRNLAQRLGAPITVKTVEADALLAKHEASENEATA